MIGEKAFMLFVREPGVEETASQRQLGFVNGQNCCRVCMRSVGRRRALQRCGIGAGQDEMAGGGAALLCGGCDAAERVNETSRLWLAESQSQSCHVAFFLLVIALARL